MKRTLWTLSYSSASGGPRGAWCGVVLRGDAAAGLGGDTELRSGTFSFLVFGVFCLFSLLPLLVVWEEGTNLLFAAWLPQAAQGRQVSEILVEDVSLCPGEGSV